MAQFRHAELSAPIASRLPWVGTTIFTVMSRLAAEHGAINLSQGFPDFSAPQALFDLVAKHMNAGANQYARWPARCRCARPSPRRSPRSTD
jgi:aspartate/methionine/tyrosine aminotransferase